MKPIILLLLLLVQSLYAADEFGSLMKRVTFNWNTFDITSKLDGRQTVSTDGEVMNFVFCGAFENFGRDGSCTYTYDYCTEVKGQRTYDRKDGSGTTPARLISAKNYTYQCYSVSNSIPKFAELHASGTLYCPIKYIVKYTCTEDKVAETPFVPNLKIVSLVVGVCLMIVGFCTYKMGEKRGVYKTLRDSAKEVGANTGYINLASNGENPFEKTT